VEMLLPLPLIPKQMTPNKIRELIDKEADARFGETIERLLTIVRNRHTHKCHEKECWCEYCRFIRDEYVKTKLRLHRLKKYIRHYDNGDFDRIGSEFDAAGWESYQQYWNLNFKLVNLKFHIKDLKSHKKDLQTNII